MKKNNLKLTILDNKYKTKRETIKTTAVVGYE